MFSEAFVCPRLCPGTASVHERPPFPRYGGRVGGTHPTGIHSCFRVFFILRPTDLLTCSFPPQARRTRGRCCCRCSGTTGAAHACRSTTHRNYAGSGSGYFRPSLTRRSASNTSRSTCSTTISYSAGSWLKVHSHRKRKRY